jgi:uncharacterized iron-regulated protein
MLLGKTYLVVNHSTATYKDNEDKALEFYIFEEPYVQPDTTTLENAIIGAKTFLSVMYTIVSFEALTDAIEAAEELLVKDYYTAAEVDTAKIDILNAVSGLTYDLPDTESLEKAITAAKAYTSDRYTVTSYQALSSAISEAEAVLAKEYYTADEVEEAETELENAVSGLTYDLPDTESLESAITAAKAYISDMYTVTSFEVLSSAISEAEAVFAKEYYTASEVEEAETQLANALSGLTYDLPDIESLESAITAAKAYTSDMYTVTSFEALSSAISDAEAVLAKEYYTADEVEEAYTALTAAVDALELTPANWPETVELVETLDEAEEIEDIGYVPVTWDNLQLSITDGRALLRTVYTPSQAVSAKTRVVTSVQALEIYVAPEPEPEPQPEPTPDDVFEPWKPEPGSKLETYTNNLKSGNVIDFIIPVENIFVSNVKAALPALLGLFGIYLLIKIIPKVFKIFLGVLHR